MTEKRRATHLSAGSEFGSDFAKVDAHTITAQEYEAMPELSEEDLARIVPGNGEGLATRLRGRPHSESPKQQVTLRLDADVLAGIRATGAGWHGRVNAALRDWLHRRGQGGGSR